MTLYDETTRRSRETDALYRKLRSLGLVLHTVRDADRPGGYKVVVAGLKSLNPAHADRLMRLVMDHEAALARLALEERGPGLRDVEEGDGTQ